ncbi:hypothetical protein BCR33DRAFT_719469 [Rhizoclosmatium globosum]|uniref:Uncharacterized protein n=1 Tax=Rhizoclosmatium globosum TaxID=329046 RepID=A0A1Y2C0D5_9FUNG|nr:hypothetical protein BCR33DRAFT_719469 [Rhizoclosmatium globosum]|eukprot:ORY40503.1 hypothetical protein BCR33DRAFT_719469 [Rhizoclosmatium globosum]
MKRSKRQNPFVLIEGTSLTGFQLDIQPRLIPAPTAPTQNQNQNSNSNNNPQQQQLRTNTAIDATTATTLALPVPHSLASELDKALSKKLQHRIIYKPPPGENRKSLIALHDEAIKAMLSQQEQDREKRRIRIQGGCCGGFDKHWGNVPDVGSLFTDEDVFHVGGPVEPWAEASTDVFNEFHVQLHNTTLPSILFPSSCGGGGGNGATPSWEMRQKELLKDGSSEKGKKGGKVVGTPGSAVVRYAVAEDSADVSVGNARTPGTAVTQFKLHSSLESRRAEELEEMEDATRAAEAKVAALVLLKDKSLDYQAPSVPQSGGFSARQLSTNNGKPDLCFEYQQYQNQLRQTLQAQLAQSGFSKPQQQSNTKSSAHTIPPNSLISSAATILDLEHSAAPTNQSNSDARYLNRSGNGPLNIRDVKKLFPPVPGNIAPKGGVRRKSKWATSQTVVHKRDVEGLFYPDGDTASTRDDNKTRSQLKQKLLQARANLAKNSSVTKLPDVFPRISLTSPDSPPSTATIKNTLPIATITTSDTTTSLPNLPLVPQKPSSRDSILHRHSVPYLPRKLTTTTQTHNMHPPLVYLETPIRIADQIQQERMRYAEVSNGRGVVGGYVKPVPQKGVGFMSRSSNGGGGDGSGKRYSMTKSLSLLSLNCSIGGGMTVSDRKSIADREREKKKSGRWYDGVEGSAVFGGVSPNKAVVRNLEIAYGNREDCKNGVDPVLLASKLAKNMHSVIARM